METESKGETSSVELPKNRFDLELEFGTSGFKGAELPQLCVCTRSSHALLTF